MTEKDMSYRALLDSLKKARLIRDDKAQSVADRLHLEMDKPAAPLFIKFLIALGAWCATIFFVAFLGFADLFKSGGGAFIGIGLPLIAVATVLMRLAKGAGIFPAQLALALNLTGHGAVLFGAAECAGEFTPVPWAMLLLYAVLYWPYNDASYRFIGALATTCLFTGWFLSERELHHFIHVLVALETAGVVLLFPNPRAALRPFAYGLALSLCATPLFVLMPDNELMTPILPSGCVIVLGLIAVFYRIAAGCGKVKSEQFIIAVLAAAFLCFSTPGIPAAAMLITLGYWQDNKGLAGMGLLFLPAYIFAYYYNLNMTLLHKSFVLMGSGAVLILLKFLIGMRPWMKNAPADENGEQ